MDTPDKQNQQYESNEMNVSLEPNDDINEQDRFLPIANVGKFFKFHSTLKSKL
jgi:hypothetical protein